MEKLCLVKSCPPDFGFFYELLKERDTFVNISHKKLPTKEESDEFNASEPYFYDFTVWLKESTNDSKRIGRVYISKFFEVGIFFKNEYQGKGYGTEALRLLLEKAKARKYYANISPLNIRSQKFFSKFGFKLIQYTYLLECPENIGENDRNTY